MVLRRVSGWPGLLLMWVAGVDYERVKTKWDRARYVGLGAAVLVTTVLAFASMATALAYALRAGPAVYVPVAAVYGAAIFNFDRLVASHVSDATGWKRFKQYLPRVVLAVVIGVVIAEPLVLRIYEPEITAKMAVLQRDAERAIAQSVRSDPALAGQRATLEARRKRNDAQLAAANARVDKALAAFDRETAGTGGTRIPGYGRVAEARSAELRRATEARDAVKRRVERENATITRALSRWEERTRKEIARQAAKSRTGNGFLAREHALHVLTKENPDLASRRWALTGVLVLLDCLVLALAALWPPSAYEKEIASHERVDDARRVEQERTETELAAYAARLRLAAEKKRLALLAEAQATVDGAMVQKWIDDQLARIASGFAPDAEPPFAAAWTGRARPGEDVRRERAGEPATAPGAATPGGGRRAPHPVPERARRPEPARRTITVGTVIKLVFNGVRVRVSPRWTFSLAALMSLVVPSTQAAPAAGRVLATASVTATEAAVVTVPGFVEVVLPRDGVTGPGTLTIVESNVYVPHGLGRPVTVDVAGTRLTAPLSVHVEVPNADRQRTPRLMTYDAAKQRWIRVRAAWDGRVLRAAVPAAGVPMIAVP